MTNLSTSALELQAELGNYGGSLPVYIEDLTGDLREIGVVASRTLPEGVAIVIEMGIPKHDDED